jgi:ABC-type transporter Mla subunit MlaD
VNSVIGPLLIPPRLMMRALDDLHTLATSSAKIADGVAELSNIERRLRERLEALDRSLSGLTSLSDDLRHTVEQLRTLERAVLSLIGSTDALSVAIQPLEAFGRRMGRFAERFPGRREAGTGSPVDPG